MESVGEKNGEGEKSEKVQHPLMGSEDGKELVGEGVKRVGFERYLQSH